MKERKEIEEEIADREITVSSQKKENKLGIQKSEDRIQNITRE